MMVNALNQLIDLPTEIITFSDDMDGLRKVPENVPNQKLLNDNLHKPLTQVAIFFTSKFAVSLILFIVFIIGIMRTFFSGP